MESLLSDEPLGGVTLVLPGGRRAGSTSYKKLNTMSEPTSEKWLRFGEFLLAQQKVTAADISTALELQKSRHIRLGELAREKKLLTDDQIDKIVEFQSQMNVKFGDAAIEFGLLNANQVDALLVEQKARHAMIGEILVEMDRLDCLTLEENLDDYFEALSSENELIAVDSLFTKER